MTLLKLDTYLAINQYIRTNIQIEAMMTARSSVNGLLKFVFVSILILKQIHITYLFRVLCCFQHCTGHITTGSFMVKFARHCKLPTICKLLPTFPHKVWVFESRTSEVGGSNHCTTVFPQIHIISQETKTIVPSYGKKLCNYSH